MGEREARALGAGTTLKVGGKEYKLRPVTVQYLCDLEREALEFYKQEYLKTYFDHLSKLGERGQTMLEKKLDEVASWSLDDLPKKRAYGVNRIPITAKLKKWALEFRSEVGGATDEELTDDQIRGLVSTALDRERLKPETVKELTGRFPQQGNVRYDQWWVTGTMEGMVSFIFASICQEHKDVTKEEIKGWDAASVFEGAREVEKITVPSMGNG